MNLTFSFSFHIIQVTMLIFGMKAHLINTHLLVPRSRSSAKVKIEYQSYISQKNGRFGGITVSQTHLVYTNYPEFEPQSFAKNIEGKGEIAFNEQFLLFPPFFKIISINFPTFYLQLKLLYANSLTLPEQALVFTCLQYMSFENTVGKGEIARKEQFLLVPQRFLPAWRTFCHFQRI